MKFDDHGYRVDPCPSCDNVGWARDTPDKCLWCNPPMEAPAITKRVDNKKSPSIRLPRTLKQCVEMKRYLQFRGEHVPRELDQKIELLRAR